MNKTELVPVAEGHCENHRVDHSFRVGILAEVIFKEELVNAPPLIKQDPEFFLNAIGWTAVLHDREMNSREDFNHGENAATQVDNIIGNRMSLNGKNLVRMLCIYHVPDDSEITGLDDTQLWLLKVFKDADSLDRVRFVNNGDALDESYLRSESAKRLISKARELWEKTNQGFNSQEEAFDGVITAAVEIGLVNQQ